MTIIYDFDGTLTPYSMPQYAILKKTKHSNDEFLKLVKEKIKNENISLYDAYYETIKNLLIENNISFTKENICLNSSNVEFNKGVLDFFYKFKSEVSGIKHYIVTSGFEDYIRKTPINKYVDGIYGTTFNNNSNGEYTTINRLMTDQYKVNAIKSIVQKENDNNIIYFGDGLTDEFAFQYVKEIGGTTVFVASDMDNNANLNNLTKKNLIDKVFETDFSINSNIYKFIENLK